MFMSPLTGLGLKLNVLNYKHAAPPGLRKQALESELHAELDGARRAGRGQRAEAAVGEVDLQVAEVRPVEGVEDVGLELQLHPLGQADAAAEGEVPHLRARPFDG